MKAQGPLVLMPSLHRQYSSDQPTAIQMFTISDEASVKLKLVSISQSKSKVKEISILTLIKNSFKRYVREQLVDFPQDIRFAGKRCIAIPDLYNILPVSNANTDANNLVVWKINRRQTVNKYSSMQLICWDSSFIVEGCTHV